MSTPPAESGTPERSANQSPAAPAPSTLGSGPTGGEFDHVAARKTTGTMPEPPNRFGTGPLPTIPGYEILGELGRGGMSVVYKARQTKLKRTVAVKMMLGGRYAAPQVSHRLRLEAETVARLNHANIVQVYDTGEVDGLPFLVLEYVEGGSLQEKLADGPLPIPDALRIVEAIARAVAAAHAADIIHRDLKPGNVLLTPDGQPKVADFGLAKDLTAEGQTVTGAIFGTPSYMAPEQAEGLVKAIGPPTDVYALGAILYALLAGRPPFYGESNQHTLHLVRSHAPQRLRKLRPDVPAGVETVCLRCLEKDSAARYPSAADLADELARVGAGGSPAAGTTPARRRKWLILASAGLLAAGLVAVLAGIWPNGSGHRANDPPPGDGGRMAAVTAGENVFALLIGVKEHEKPDINSLEYTENDVELLARVLQTQGIPRSNLTLLTTWHGKMKPGLRPTRANILARLRAMAENAMEDDTVIVAFSGMGSRRATVETDPPHGPLRLSDDGFCEFLVPSDGDLSSMEAARASMLHAADIAPFFEQCRARTKLLVIDACHAGGIADRLAKVPNLAVIGCCEPKQFSFESNRLRHGIFSYYLIEALRGDNGADSNANGIIELEELTTHVAERTPERVAAEFPGSPQRPVWISNLSGATPIVWLKRPGQERAAPPLQALPKRTRIEVFGPADDGPGR